MVIWVRVIVWVKVRVEVAQQLSSLFPKTDWLTHMQAVSLLSQKIWMLTPQLN